MDITLEARTLLVGRGRTPAAGPFDFALSPGEGLVVTGPNGAGKSTLLRTLAGLLPPLGGEVRVSGALAPDGEPARGVREIAHYVGHRNAMKPGLSVGANLDFWRELFSLGGKGATNASALEALGLPDLAHLPFGYLSAGQQRRTSLARLLVAPRDVWILDEPTTALDTDSQALFAAIMRAHLAAGGLVIAATHQPLGLEDAGRLDLTGRFLPSNGMSVPEPEIADDELASAEGWL